MKKISNWFLIHLRSTSRFQTLLKAPLAAIRVALFQ